MRPIARSMAQPGWSRLATRCQSTSDPSPPSPRPTRVTLVDRREENKRRTLQHLAYNAESALVSGGPPPPAFRARRSAPRAPLDTLDVSSSVLLAPREPGSPAPEPLRYEPPKLKDNPYVDQFVVHDAELDDWEEPLPGGSKETSRHDSRPAGERPRRWGKAHRHRIPPRRPSALSETRPDERPGGRPGQSASSSSSRLGVESRQSPRVLRIGDSESHGTVELHVGYIVFRPVQSPSISAPSQPTIPLTRLRERCDCDQCVHPTTRQRTFSLGEILDQVESSPFANSVPDKHSVFEQDGKLHVMWGSTGNTHHSVYTAQQLSSTLARLSPQLKYLTHDLEKKHWSEGSAVEGIRSFRVHYPLTSNDQKAKDAKLLEILEDLQVYGIAILQGVPTDKTSSDKCALKKFANEVGDIKSTFYGKLWNVQNKKDSTNVAYTDLNLGLHMDLLYYTDPPRFQLLHCLRNRVIGGESYFVDSFAAMDDLFRDHPRAASSLQSLSIAYEYDNDGHYLTNFHPVLPPSNRGLRRTIAWSPPFQAFWRHKTSHPSSDAGSEALVEADVSYLQAVKLWETYLADPKRRYTFKMQEGDLVLFDNRRVLHARHAFRNMSKEERVKEGVKIVPGEPTRWLKGCYLDAEPVWDKLVSLKKPT